MQPIRLSPFRSLIGKTIICCRKINDSKNLGSGELTQLPSARRFAVSNCGILKPTSGTISFDGIDVSEKNYRSILGYLPQDFGYYPEFSGIAQSTKTSRFR